MKRGPALPGAVCQPLSLLLALSWQPWPPVLAKRSPSSEVQQECPAAGALRSIARHRSARRSPPPPRHWLRRSHPCSAQDMQRDLRTAQQQRQLTEAEASQLAAVNQRLSAENADLAATSSSLKAENEALAARADSLLERQAALESAAESLKLENCTLLQQFDRLKIKYEHEAAGFQEQVGAGGCWWVLVGAGQCCWVLGAAQCSHLASAPGSR